MGGERSANGSVSRSAIFAASPHGYLVLDTDLKIIDVNDRYLFITGSKAEDLVGKHLFDAFPDEKAPLALGRSSPSICPSAPRKSRQRKRLWPRDRSLPNSGRGLFL